MLFPTAVFAIFFAIVFALHWSLPQRSLARKVFLLLASLFFYGWWSWKFALMLLASALLNHGIARLISWSSAPSPRKCLLVLGVSLNLLVLAFFKYTDFIFTKWFLPLAIPVSRWLGTTEALMDFNLDVAFPFLETIVLPVGISFYTFQALSYVVDVYRRQCDPAPSVLDFANYLAFFPQLVAGPIVRASVLLPQMAVLPPRSTKLDTGRAMTLILAGLFKKMVVANWIALHLADPLFDDPTAYGALDAAIGVLGYAMQIYCDFSAYSDIATGCALLLGFSFPSNFLAPYFAVSLQEFWRRWHISLSSWLRDYLYIPLGGSRCASWKIYRNLAITMLLGGLWHGAKWDFVIWGAILGLGLSVERAILPRRKKDAPSPPPSPWRFVTVPVHWLVTMLIVCFAWIFFRSAYVEGLDTATQVLSAFTRFDAPSVLATPLAAIILAVAFLLQFLDGDRPRPVWNLFNRLHPVHQGLVAAILLTIILGLGPAGVAPFIYFKF